jgi:hypothetical protein
MDKQDLETFSKIGTALWLDLEYARKFAAETLAATTLLDLTPERALEKASTALLHCSKRRAVDSQINSEYLSHSFYRLLPEERMVLTALHLGRWSYARLGRILRLNEEELQELLWSARLQFAAASLRDTEYPAAPSTLGPRCPEYNPRQPWTQRFLDEEIPSKGQLFFLQTHLLECASCRDCLARTRDVYFKITEAIARFTDSSVRVQDLEKILRQSTFHKFASQRSFGESWVIFLRRPYVKLMLLGLGAIVAVIYLKT